MKKTFAVAIVSLMFFGTSCGDEAKVEEDQLIRVDLVDDAIAAVETWNASQTTSLIDEGEDELQYFEINATPTLVNIYVATKNATEAVAFIYDADGLQDPDAPQEASGSTVKWSEIDSDITKSAVYQKVVEALPQSDISRFVIGRDPEFDKLTYRVVMVSANGGEFAAYVDPSGKIIGGDLLG